MPQYWSSAKDLLQTCWSPALHWRAELQLSILVHTNYPLLNYARSSFLDKEAEKLGNYLTESVNLLCTLSRCFIQRFKDLCTGNSLKGARGGLAPPGIQNHASPPKLSKRNLINRKTPMDLCWPNHLMVIIFADKRPSFTSTHCV